MGYYISGNVTVKVTETQEVLLVLRQQDLADRLQTIYGRTSDADFRKTVGMSVKDAILHWTDIEVYDNPEEDEEGAGEEDDGDALAFVIDGYPPEKLRDDLFITLRWAAESGADVFAQIFGEDELRWIWRTNFDTFELDEIILESYPADKIALVEGLAHTYRVNPELWDTTPVEVAALLKKLFH